MTYGILFYFRNVLVRWVNKTDLSLFNSAQNLALLRLQQSAEKEKATIKMQMLFRQKQSRVE
jgi:hypothetical protein